MSGAPRTATLADLDALAALEREAFLEPWSAAALHTALTEPRYLVLLVPSADGGVAAYIAGWTVATEAEIARLATSPSQRRKGLAGLLLQEFLRVASLRGAEVAFLEVREGNEAALGLYASCEFRQLGARPNYYPDGEAAVLLQRELR